MEEKQEVRGSTRPVEASQWSADKWTLEFTLDEKGTCRMALSKEGTGP